jgi:hypothetical protein
MRNACLVMVTLTVYIALVCADTTTTPRVWHTGNDFLSICAVEADKSINELTASELHATSGCIPYVRGLGDGIALLGEPCCEPDQVTNGQEESILVKYIRDHPETAHLSTARLYLVAMGKAFPCPKKK